MFIKKLLPLFLLSLMLLCFCISINATITYSAVTPSTGSYGVSPNIANWSITTTNATGNHAISGVIKLYYASSNMSTGYSRTLNNVAVNGTYALNFTSGLYWGRDYIIYLGLHEY